MEDLEKLVKSILDQGYLMSLATVDESGPWVSDLIFVPEDLNLYWISEEDTRHSKAILQNSKVAATITISNRGGEDNVGLQIEGLAEKVEGDILEIAIKHRLKRNKPAPKAVGEILDPEESWYLLKPTKIEIIYEPKWGFDKKELPLK
jgi:uncharacterized protein YhbP (UPF0306 family)